MAIYRTVCLSFWTDPKIADDFTPEDRYFYLYLFTNPHTNLCGCYEMSIRQIASETGYSKETIERLLERFSKIHQVAHYSKETKEILLVNWHKYNWTASEKFRKPLSEQIKKVKDATFRKYLSDLFDGKEVRYGIDTTCIDTDCTDTSVSVLYTDTVTDTVSEEDTNTLNNLIEQHNFSKTLQQSIKDWMKYKEEKGKGYQDTAFQKFLNMIEKKLKSIPEDQIISLMTRCMANNYDGLVWELIEKPRGKPSTWSNLESDERIKKRDDFLDQFQQHIVGG